MVLLALVLTGLAALLHVYIFWLESIAWTTPRARATFGTTAEVAETTRPMAYNQGFYNLFLAAQVAIGWVLVASDHEAAGAALVLAGAGSMVLAALVLALSDRSKLRAAAVQGTAAFLGVVALAIALPLA